MKQKLLSLLLALTLCAGLCSGLTSPVSAASSLEFQQPRLETSIYNGKDGRNTFALLANGELWAYQADRDQVGEYSSKLLLNNVVAVTANTANDALSRMYALALQADGTVWECVIGGEMAATKSDTGVVQICDMTYLKSNGDLYTYRQYLDDGIPKYKKELAAANVISFIDGSKYITSDHVLHYGSNATMPGFRTLLRATGSDTWFAISDSNDLYGWGYHVYGQAGTGADITLIDYSVSYLMIDIVYNGYTYPKLSATTPMKILSNVEEMYFDDHRIYAKDASGTLWQWGDSPERVRIKFGDTTAKVLEDLHFSDGTYASPRRSNSEIPTYGEVNHIIIKTDGTLWMPFEDWFNQSGAVVEIKLPITYSDLKTSGAPSNEVPPTQTPSSWANDAANWIAGYPEIHEWFDGYWQYEICRSEFAAVTVTMVEEALGKSLATAPASTFADTSDDYVLKAYQAGIVTGTSSTAFSPYDSLTREQLATMLYRAIQYIEQERGESILTKTGTLDRFTDQRQVSSWAVEGITALTSNGIMAGTSETTLSPKSTATIEQALVLAFRVLDGLN